MYMTADVKIFASHVEQSCLDQIQEVANCEAFMGARIRIMPDCHSGKGCVIGFTADYMSNAVPNLVGVDIGCFTADTEIALADNRNITFTQLIDEYKKGKTNYCYCIDSNNQIRIEKISFPRYIKSVDYLVDIKLDNDKTVTCTLDHEIYLRNGTTKPASELKVGDKLMPLSITKGNQLDNVYGTGHGTIIKRFPEYNCVYDPANKRYVLCHRVADDYNVRHSIYDAATLNKGIRHHIDIDKLNNNPDNIIRLTSKEHFQVHAKYEHDNPELSVIGKLSPEQRVSLASKAGKVGMAKNWSNPEFRKRQKVWIHNQHFSEETRKYLSDCKKQYNPGGFKRGSENPAKQDATKWKIKLGKCKKPIEALISRNIDCTEANYNEYIKTNKKYSNVPWWWVVAVAEHYNIDISDIPTYTNHEVVSVQVRYAPNTPVYCLTNQQYGNFGLAAGIIVHNCGMYVRKLADKITDFEKFDKAVREVVPMGFEVNDRYMFSLSDDYDFLCFSKLKNKGRIEQSLGTLGGGNHFIEVDEAQDGSQYLVIHTGSRNLGLQVCNIYQSLAEKRCADKGLKDLAYLCYADRDDYLHDMKQAQKFARANRERIADAIAGKYGLQFDKIERWHTVHNYIDDYGTVRKGAISAFKNERVIIPLNMRDGCIIGSGKGNTDWNCSAPHGAGRVMSRHEAFKELDVEKFKQQMKGVYSTSVCKETMDEAPDAYKRAVDVIPWLRHTVDIKDVLIPKYNAKAVQ